MIEKPSKALMIALRNFVFRREIFVEAGEFDDGFVFARQPKGRAKRFGPRRHFEVFLRRNKRRVRSYTLTCGSEDYQRSQVPIDFPREGASAAGGGRARVRSVRPRRETLLGTLPNGRRRRSRAFRLCAIGVAPS